MKRTMKMLLILAILLLSTSLVHGSPHSLNNAVITTASSQSLSIAKLHTNATGISSCSVDIALPNGALTKVSGTLFGMIRIVMNATWSNSNSTYQLMLSSFYLLITQKNIVVSNSTNINQNQNPTNTIQSVTLFPQIPVILILSFSPVCVTPSNIARLVYVDGNFNYVFSLP